MASAAAIKRQWLAPFRSIESPLFKLKNVNPGTLDGKWGGIAAELLRSRGNSRAINKPGRKQAGRKNKNAGLDFSRPAKMTPRYWLDKPITG
jgi:hypothetical protein